MFRPPPNHREPASEDTQFLEGLIAQQQLPLLRYATRLLHDPERARDVVQDTFAKLLVEPRPAIDGHAVEWLFTVCRHRAFDLLRKENRLRPFPDGETANLVSTDPPPGQSLEQEETQTSLLALIARLPPNQQEVVRLRFQHGFSYKEIAGITGLSVSNVGFLIHTAVARLRTEFAIQQP